jgi:hypothetical protein
VSVVSETHTKCVFIGGTLNGTTQGRLMRGYVPVTLMEPIYTPIGKDADCLYKNITHRQLYVRSTKVQLDGAVTYLFDRAEAA